MLRLVAQGLGIDTGAVEKARLLDAVEQQLERDLAAGRRTLLSSTRRRTCRSRRSKSCACSPTSRSAGAR